MNRDTLEEWKRVHREGAAYAGWSIPEPPASENEIADAEERLGRVIPPQLKEILRCSRSWLWREKGFDAIVFLPPDEIVAESIEPPDGGINVALSRSERVKAYFYSPNRITFAFSDYYRFQIDEDPANGGTPGQIVVADIEEEFVDVIAPSLDAFVRRGISCLEEQLRGGYPEQAA